MNKYCNIIFPAGNSLPEFQEHGYLVDFQLRQRLTETLKLILADSPHKSEIRARLTKLDQGFKFYLLVHHRNGSLYVTTISSSSENAIQKALNQMYLQTQQLQQEMLIADSSSTKTQSLGLEL